MLVNEKIELNSAWNVVQKLNKLLSIDPKLIREITDTRYPVSQDYLADDSLVCMETENGGETGLLGILNSIIVDSTQFRIFGYYDDNNLLTHFGLFQFQNGKFVEIKQ
jgi:hypothetical protein